MMYNDIVRFTIQEFNELYGTKLKCLQAILEMKGFKCESCGFHHYWINKQRKAVCKNCLKAHTITKDTIFFNSKTDIRNWFYALWLISNSKNGVSAQQLQRDTGMSYHTCFYMLHKIRLMMRDNKKKLSGVVEIDETYIGGKNKNRARDFYSKKAYPKKKIIFGMMERGGRVIVKKVPDNKKDTLMSVVEKNVKKGSTVYSDELLSYKALPELGYKHDFTDHQRQHVKGKVHTQCIEGFWGQLKRNVLGSYKKVSEKYVEAYAWEAAFHHNYRSLGGRAFDLLLNRAVYEWPKIKAR